MLPREDAMKKLFEPTEAETQRAIIELLRLAGFKVWSSSRVRRRCSQCGSFSSGGDGVDKGLPDIVFCHPRIPRLMGGIEVKGPKTAISPEQRAAADLDCYAICRSVDEAALAVFVWWRSYAHGPFPVPSAISSLVRGGQ